MFTRKDKMSLKYAKCGQILTELKFQIFKNDSIPKWGHLSTSLIVMTIESCN